MKEQTIKLSEEDRKLIKQTVKWLKFPPFNVSCIMDCYFYGSIYFVVGVI